MDTYACFLGYLAALLGEGDGLDGFDHEVAREVTADEADHLVVVQASNSVVIRRAMKNLPDLLQEALPIQLCGADKGVFSQEDVFSSKSGVETVKMKDV